jgi:hypothetical protein
MGSPEAKLIVLCTREADRAFAAELAAACAAVEDWPRVVDLATRHRVVAYVRRGLAAAGFRPPVEIERALGVALLRASDKLVRLNIRLRDIATRMQAAGVPLLVLKGPVLGPLLYPSASFRPFSDLDLLVPEPYMDQAEAILGECGLAELAYPPEVARREHADHVHDGAEFHRMFVSADDQELIELHLDPLQLGMRLTPEGARWSRAVPVAGLPGALMLSLPDQLVHLSVHAHKHGFNRLVWLKDLDLLIRGQADAMDWARALEIARAEGVTASVWYALFLSRKLLGTPVPPAWLRQTRPAAPLRLIYRCVWPTTRIAGLDGHMRRRAIQFHVADSWRGMLPSLVLMGRRRTRARAIVRAVLH